MGDYDNDGWPDLYLTNYGPSQLWRNRGDGTFEDVTAAAGCGRHALVHERGLPGLRPRRVARPLRGRLRRLRPGHPQAVPEPRGHPRLLRPACPTPPRPTGSSATAATAPSRTSAARAGILAEPGSGLGVVAADFDRDGWPDVYVANDQMRNVLWMNQRDGTFRDNGLHVGHAPSTPAATPWAAWAWPRETRTTTATWTCS